MKKLLNAKRLDFLDYMSQLQGYSQLTIKSYDEAIRQMLEKCKLDDESDTTVIDLMPLRLFIKDQSPKTITKKLSAIRSFVKYLNENKVKIKLRNDDSIKTASSLPKPVAHKYIKEALEIADEFDRLTITMLYTLGLRISELINIKLNDISDEWIKVLGKGNRYRNVPLLEVTNALIKQHIEKTKPKLYLFEKENSKLSENSIRYKINKLFKKIGLKVSPHQLRHSYATELLNDDARISDVSELLGHKSMATTQIYTKLSSSLKMKSYINAHPLCKGVDEHSR